MILRPDFAGKWLALIGAGLFLICAQAAPSKIDTRRDELKSLREQIQALQGEIGKSEEDRGEAADQLAESERSISDSQRRLREIADDRLAIEAELEKLRAEGVRLEGELATARKRLGTTLYRIYVEGGEAGARRLLSGHDPNQMARDAHYLELIAQQRATTIAQARQALVHLQEVQAEAEARHAEARRLEAERTEEQRRLFDQRSKRRLVLQQVAERVKAQRREMQGLQRGQVRLEKLLVGLERIEKERTEKARAEKERLARARGSRKAGVSASGRVQAQSSSVHDGEQQVAPARPSGQAEEVAEPEDRSGVEFARLQGRLRWPVRGELFGRFGAPRGEGGVWRGVFIKAAEGNEVRAVANGKVAYADWLRGFGNLIIVDHGGGYMTIYANNDALFKTPGQSVRTGEPIASVGASGGEEQSGLYFEIRHRGQPADPLKWVATK